MEWPTVRLEQVASIIGGSTPRREISDYWDGSVPWLTPTDLPMPGAGIAKVTGTSEMITEAGLSSISAQLLPVGTVLFSSRATIGKIGIAAVPLATNQGFANFIPKKCVDSIYLAYFLQFNTNIISQLAGTTTFKEVTKSSIRKAKIPIPPISEQHRIVEILEQADQLRKLSAQAKAKAEHILPSLFIKMFGNPATNTSMRPKQPFSALVEIGTRLVDPTQPEFSDFPHIGGEQIEKNSGRILDCKLVKESDLRSSKFIFSEKHILYSKIRPYLNKVAFPKFKGLCSADIYPLLPKHPAITPWYLVAALRTQAFLSYALTCSDRLRMPKLNKEQLGAFLLSVPDMKTVAVFEDQAELIAKMILHRAKVSEQTESFFLILLHRAFSGNLTAAWREAHMKELLVEMEQQTKALNDH